MSRSKELKTIQDFKAFFDGYEAFQERATKRELEEEMKNQYCSIWPNYKAAMEYWKDKHDTINDMNMYEWEEEYVYGAYDD